MEYKEMLILSFLLQLFGCYYLKKTITEIKDNNAITRKLKVSFYVFVVALILQLFLIIDMIYAMLFIKPKLDNNLQNLQELHRSAIR